MTFYGEMIRIRQRLADARVDALVPDAEDDLMSASSSERFEEIRRALSMNHIRRIRHPKTFGILVVNFDKHAIADYIGPSTFAETAIAAVQGKRIFILNDLPRAYEEELLLWRAIPLHGRLEPLVALYRDACLRPIRQFEMFAA